MTLRRIDLKARRARASTRAALLPCALLILLPLCACADAQTARTTTTTATTTTPAASPPVTAAQTAAAASSPDAAGGRVEYAEFASASLGQSVRYAVSLPPGYDDAGQKAKRYPVVIFLHGLNNNERDWEENGLEAKLRAARAAGKVGEFIVALPYGANSFYLNAKDGARYEDAVVKDFLPFVDKQYRTIPEARARLIEGISMGGYGALLIAIKHPELFAGVAAHSAALFTELPQPPTGTDPRAGYRYALATKLFGAPPDAAYFQANNPLVLAQSAPARLKGLKIYFDVGAQDRYGFDAGNKQLDAALTAAGVAHEFTLAPGGHGWAFLAGRSEPALAFVWNTLRR